MPPKKDNSNESSVSNKINNSSATNDTTATAPLMTNFLAATKYLSSSAPSRTTNNTHNNNHNNKYETDFSNAADIVAEHREQVYVANAKLCRLVRKYPWMYDRKHPHYAKKQMLDKSWTKIAKVCNEPVASCKERWRNIRAAFARSVNIYKTLSGPNRVKPYYLHKELDFLVKTMMVERTKLNENDDERLGETKVELEVIEDDETNVAAVLHITTEDQQQQQLLNVEKNSSVEKQSVQMVDDEDETMQSSDFEAAFNLRINSPSYYQHDVSLDNSNLIATNKRSRQNEDNENENKHMTTTLGSCGSNLTASTANLSTNNCSSSVHLSPQSNPTTGAIQLSAVTAETSSMNAATASRTDADVKFLEALLPDMKAMNTRQKIIFKRKIYQTLEEVFENNADFPTTQQQKTTTTEISATAATNGYGHHASIPQANTVIPSLTIKATTQQRQQQHQQQLLPIRIKDEVDDIEID